MKQSIRENLYSDVIRDSKYKKEGMKGKLSFNKLKEEARKKPAFYRVLSNPESKVIELAEGIIEGKNYSEVLSISLKDYKNYVKDSGEDAFMLAVICEELAERKTGIKEVQNNN